MTKQDSLDYYTDDFEVIPKTDSPLFQKLTEDFKKQKHRFEANNCEFKYNDQSFALGDDKEKVFGILGVPDGESGITLNGKAMSFIYDSLKLFVQFSISDERLTYCQFFLTNYDGTHEETPFDIIMIYDVPYHLDMDLNQFMALTNLNHDILRRTSGNFYLVQKGCDIDEDQRVITIIGSIPSYETTSIGHFTHQGAFDPTSTGSIRDLAFGFTTLKQLKK